MSVWSEQRIWHNFKLLSTGRGFPGEKYQPLKTSLLGTCKMGSSEAGDLGKVDPVLLGRRRSLRASSPAFLRCELLLQGGQSRARSPYARC